MHDYWHILFGLALLAALYWVISNDARKHAYGRDGYVMHQPEFDQDPYYYDEYAVTPASYAYATYPSTSPTYPSSYVEYPYESTQTTNAYTYTYPTKTSTAGVPASMYGPSPTYPGAYLPLPPRGANTSYKPFSLSHPITAGGVDELQAT